MKEQIRPPFPRRKELENAPLPPRLVMEISRLLRAGLSHEESGVMAQSTARLVMAHLAAKGSMGQLEIVQLVHLKPSTVSVLLRRMEAEGYVTRVPDENDRRAMRVALTEAGIAFDRDRLTQLSSNDERAMRGFSDRERATLESLLSRMRDNLKGDAE